METSNYPHGVLAAGALVMVEQNVACKCRSAVEIVVAYWLLVGSNGHIITI